MTTPFATPTEASPNDIGAALAEARSQTGKTLAELSVRSPLLLIFGEGKRETKARQLQQLEPAGAGV